MEAFFNETLRHTKQALYTVDKVHSVLQSDVYTFNGKSMGRALIFNQVNFDKTNKDLNLNMGTRFGSTKDATDLEEVLIKYGFRTEIFTDLTVSGIKEVLENGEVIKN